MASYNSKQMIPLKVILFFLFAAIGSLAPFLSTHVKEMGLSAEEVGFINLVSGFFSLLGPILGGIVTEKHGRYKIMLCVFLVLTAASYTGLLFIPSVVRMETRIPEIELSCGTSRASILLEKCPNWGRCFASHRNLSAEFEAYSCRYSCPGDESFFESPSVCFVGSRTDRELCRFFNTSSKSDQFKISSPDLFRKAVSTKVTKFRKLAHEAVTEMCVYPLDKMSSSGYHFHGLTCNTARKGCKFVCLLKEEVVKSEATNSIYKSMKPCLDIIGDPFVTFYLYLAVRSVADMLMMTVISLVDTLSVLSISEYKRNYGNTRLWAALGLCIFGPVSGALIDFYTDSEGHVNYFPAFLIFDGFMLITAVLSSALPISGEIILDRTRSGCTKCLKLCQSAEGLIVFLLVLVLGVLWGFLDIFFYWRAIDLGANKLLIGLTLTVAFLCSAPFLAYSNSIIRGFGKANLLVYAFFFYCIRFLGYSFVTEPWWLLPFQTMEVFSMSLMWIGAVAYAHSLAPPGFRVTTQGTLIALHFCAGRGAGGFIGGMLIHLFGMEIAFRGTGVFSAVVGIVFWLAHMCCFRRKYKLPNQDSPSPGIALTGVYYPMDARNNHAINNNRQPNGYPKSQQAGLMDDIDEDFGAM